MNGRRLRKTPKRNARKYKAHWEGGMYYKMMDVYAMNSRLGSIIYESYAMERKTNERKNHTRVEKLAQTKFV